MARATRPPSMIAQVATSQINMRVQPAPITLKTPSRRRTRAHRATIPTTRKPMARQSGIVRQPNQMEACSKAKYQSSKSSPSYLPLLQISWWLQGSKTSEKTPKSVGFSSSSKSDHNRPCRCRILQSIRWKLHPNLNNQYRYPNANHTVKSMIVRIVSRA